ncbi:hypothetical protein [Oceanobacillus sp. FSL W7-1309]|uniref:hypothetical protein n=1 Tax=Oceanobacillus sp. FSL W7-1309 TaxID=2954539 RepID=UPI0030F4F660
MPYFCGWCPSCAEWCLIFANGVLTAWDGAFAAKNGVLTAAISPGMVLMEK